MIEIISVPSHILIGEVKSETNFTGFCVNTTSIAYWKTIYVNKAHPRISLVDLLEFPNLVNEIPQANDIFLFPSFAFDVKEYQMKMSYVGLLLAENVSQGIIRSFDGKYHQNLSLLAFETNVYSYINLSSILRNL